MLRRITTGKGRFVVWLHPVEPIGDHQNIGSRFKASQDRHGKGRFVPVGLLPVETIGDHQNNGSRSQLRRITTAKGRFVPVSHR